MKNKEKKEYIKYAIVFLVLLLLVIAFVVLKQKNQKSQPDNGNKSVPTSENNSNQSDIVYYYGLASDSHSKKVDDFFKANNVEAKIAFAKKEILTSKDNKDEFSSSASECGIKPEDAGVPFLFAKGKCYMGDTEIINFFKKELGIK